MTTTELQKILSGERKFNVKQIQQFIYEMKCDVVEEMRKPSCNVSNERFYQGEMNAFQICLNLLDNCESEVTNNDR